ncbi:MAG: DUF1549 and DUF1553 domain-containing protein [Lentisphaeraceae bacterium]|nr:DUF1549 and DUF1553 domain-containing protein [Lentisphaeraceae bacterium]
MKVLLIITVLFTTILGAETLSPEQETKVTNYIDKLIAFDLKKKRINPNAPVTDEVFLRRAYLNIAGRIPSVKEYDDFMSWNSSDRRNKLIDKLMDSPGYISHSYNYWADALRIVSVHKKKALYNYSQWLKNSIKDNKPYDQFVKELLASEGPISKRGHGAEGYYIRDYGMPLDNMSNTMQLFLGTSLVCAQCHDHPYKKWSQMDFYKLAAFTNGTYPNMSQLDVRLREKIRKSNKKNIAESKLERNLRNYFSGTYNSGTGKIQLPKDYSYNDAKPKEIIKAQVPFGNHVKIDYSSPSKPEDAPFIFRDWERKGFAKNVNSRGVFADWVTSKENPMFTKTIVNRLWQRLYGVPLIDDMLDLKQKDLGDNPKLSQFLIQLMQKIDFDTKLFMKLIYKTNSFQSIAVHDYKEAKSFKGPYAKRLTAEQIWDSLLTIKIDKPDQITKLPDYIPENVMYEHLAKMDFDEMVKFSHAVNNKTVRNLIKEHPNKNILPKHYKAGDRRAESHRYPPEPGSTLQVFGASMRQLIDGGSQEANMTQALDLMNNPNHSFRDTALSHNLRKLKSSDAKIDMIYKTILSRKPSTREKSLIKRYQNKTFDPEIVYWSLINSHEFKIGM